MSNEGPAVNLFDTTITRNDLYRSFVAPELYPEERPARIENWSAQDREMYCGGEYTRV